MTIGNALFGFRLLACKGRDWDWRVGVLPFGGMVLCDSIHDDDAIAGSDPEPNHSDESKTPTPPVPNSSDARDATDIPRPGMLEAAPAFVRVGIWLVLPLAFSVIAGILLSVAIFTGTGQLRYSPHGNAGPVWGGVPGLYVANEPTTALGQWELCWGVGRGTFERFVMFRPLLGWGGFLGWFSTVGYGGTISPSAWCTLFGYTLLVQAVLTLVWNAVSIGSRIIEALGRLVSRTMGDICRSWFILAFLLGYTIVAVRLVAADIMWFSGW